MTKTTVLIADDHPTFRMGLRQIIESEDGFDLVAEAEHGESALQLLLKHQPHVAVLDIDMPRMDGFGVVREARKQNLSFAVVFLTMHNEEDLFQEAISFGAEGYILKDCAATEIAGCIRAAAAGHSFFSPAVSRYLTQSENRPASEALRTLTANERCILALYRCA